MYSVVYEARGDLKNGSFNEPFTDLEEAKAFMKDTLQNGIDFDIPFSLFLVDNRTNGIIDSFDSYVNGLPVEYHLEKVVTMTTKAMIDNLSDLMEIKKLTKTQVSNECGMSVQNLCKFFKSDNNPTLSNFVRVSNAIHNL
ncbi:hypothetical protein [Flavobacterium phage FLiP]|uniref:Uncharacterized protein n=1 Tax=Flavobacterium phage FLiP TaxID=2023716 RepID=A0A222NP73_9VIRU|nr:hypothetical protein HOR88_gp04 [Flavobacterium phage FLiP]ASQ41219.1 hypothetical protein [Flavobacterium phage FLiP]